MASGATTLRPNQRGRWRLELGTWIVNCPPLPGPGPGNGTKTWKKTGKEQDETAQTSMVQPIRKACGGSSWTSVVTVSRWELAPSHWNAWIEHCKCEKARTQMAHKPSVLLTPTHPSWKQKANFSRFFQTRFFDSTVGVSSATRRAWCRSHTLNGELQKLSHREKLWSCGFQSHETWLWRQPKLLIV